jgi:hypothetical protein
MNRLHLVVQIQELVLAGKEPAEVYQELRSLKNPSIEDLGLKRTDVENMAKSSKTTLETALFPIEKRKLALDVQEGRLRADILDAVAGLDVSDVLVAREVWAVHQELGNSSGPASLRSALDCLEGANVDITELKRAYDELFPEAAP